MQDTIDRVRELLAQRDRIDAELQSLFSGAAPAKRTIKCGTCGEEGHSARTCPQKPQE